MLPLFVSSGGHQGRKPIARSARGGEAEQPRGTFSTVAPVAEQLTDEKIGTAGSMGFDAPGEDMGLPAVEDRPGSKDHDSFVEGESVKFWQDFDPATYDYTQDVEFTGENSRYWLYHVGRTGFFAAQGLASVAAANLAQALRGGEGSNGEDTNVTPKFLQNFLKSPASFGTATIGQAVATFKQDLQYIKDGYFKAPYDMSLRHRQFSPGYVADKGVRYIREAIGVLQRSKEKADTSTWVDSGNELYPDYFKHTFHYQTDGWLSSESAQVYESSTETLFLGRQDAMQRTTLVHIAKHMQSKDMMPSDVQLLEIGCGTGRVNTFIRDNWPTMSMTVSDLSPFYLEEARKNNQYWESRFAPANVKSATFVQANAEALPFEKETYDVVVSVYLFHELPAEAQDNVFAEAERVLVDGGLFVLTDSIQLADRPVIDAAIGDFGGFAEPHYQAYIRRDLAELARSHCFEPVAKELSSATKSLSFVKKSTAVDSP